MKLKTISAIVIATTLTFGLSACQAPPEPIVGENIAQDSTVAPKTVPASPTITTAKPKPPIEEVPQQTEEPTTESDDFYGELPYVPEEEVNGSDEVVTEEPSIDEEIPDTSDEDNAAAAEEEKYALLLTYSQDFQNQVCDLALISPVNEENVNNISEIKDAMTNDTRINTIPGVSDFINTVQLVYDAAKPYVDQDAPAENKAFFNTVCDTLIAS
jgi:hypothetical protein